MSEEDFKRSVRTQRRFRIALAASAIGMIGLGAVLYALRRSSSLDEPPLPNPNGYEDLVRAGRSIVGQVPGPKGDYQTAGADELRKWVTANQEALAIASMGLGRECRVALPPTENELQAHSDRIGDLRQLCRLMGSAARLAEIEGTRPAAIRNGLDVVKVAHCGARGGLIIDAMTGFACESIGQRILARLRDQFTAEECRTLVTALETIDLEREPVAKVVKRDRAWFSAQQNIAMRAMVAINPAAVNQLLKPAIAGLESSSHRCVAQLRLLIAELAIRRYRLEKMTDPPNLEALVPQYLAKVPVDPYSNRALHYDRVEQPEGHRLYSVGPDGRDDDGNPLTEQADWSNAIGDVLVDPPAAPPRAPRP